MKPSASAPSAIARSASSSFVTPQILTNTSARPPLHLRGAQVTDECGRLRRLHERFTDEHRVEACGGHPRRVLRAADRTLGDADDVAGEPARERTRDAEVLGERREVAAVDPYDERARIERALDLLIVVRLDQHTHT